MVARRLIPGASGGTCALAALLSFGHRGKGMISDSVTESRGLLQRLAMVTEVNWLLGCRGLGG